MPYDEELAARVREALSELPDVEEKRMFRGVTFMVNDKMCVSVSGDELMCRIDPEVQDQALMKKYSRIVVMKGRPMPGWIKISPEGISTKKDLAYWIALALDFNGRAKSPKTPGKKPTKKKHVRH